MFGLSTSTLWFIALNLIAFGVGLVGIPIFLTLFGDSLPNGPIVRILWTIGSIINDGTVLVWRDDDTYELCPVRESEYADRAGEVRIDGEWQPISAEGAGWSRLGLKDFGVIYEKSERRFEPVAASATEEDIQQMVDLGDETIAILRTVRSRWQLFSRYASDLVDDATRTADGFVVSVGRMQTRLEGAGGPAIATQMEEHAMKKYGPGSNIGNTMLIVGGIAAIFLGALMGWLVVTL